MKGKTKQTALISLAIMFVGFVATLVFNDKTILLLLQSGFEAGLVGGLADWFAVTALFRHPLGIPIPHTALLPSNRERITQALVSTVENDLLNKTSILEKVRQMDVTHKILGICESYIGSAAVKKAMISISRSIVNSIPLSDIASFIQSLAGSYADRLDSRKLLDLLVDECIEHGYDREVFDVIIDKLEDVVRHEDLHKSIGSTAISAIRKLHVNGVMQYTLGTIANLMGEDKIGGIIQDLLIAALHDLKNPEHPNRQRALELIHSNIRQFCNDEATIQKLDAYKSSLIARDSFNDFVASLLDELRVKILSTLENEVYYSNIILPYLKTVIGRISANADTVAKLDAYIQEQISSFIDNNHKRIGKLVEENIEKFDNDTLIRLIEDKVGNDLQWIRVNGAVCGFIIGIILGLVKLSGII